MSEEEKAAIECLKETIVNTYAEGKAKKLATALNLIEKQQKEIKSKEAYIDVLKHNQEVLEKQMKKKDKMIELMANYIYDRNSEGGICYERYREDCGPCDKCIKQYFENKVKEK